MTKLSKLVLTAVAASLVLAAVVGTASANRLSVSNRAIRVVWTPLDFDNIVDCNVTLEGEFVASTIEKRPKALLGRITRAAVSNCTEGVTVLTETLPWHITYQGFIGRLPTISGIRLLLVGASFLLNIFGVQCLYRATEVDNASGIANINEATGQVTGLRADETDPIPLAEGSFLCPDEGHFAGTGTVRQQGTTTGLIFVRLI